MTHRFVLLFVMLAAVPASAQDREIEADAPAPTAAQENSFGFIYTPILFLHDEDACCSAAGAWVTVGRLHIEHVVAWDSKWQKLFAEQAAEYGTPEPMTPAVDGHALTVLGTLRSWRSQRFSTRFHAGGRYVVSAEPTEEPWGLGPGLTVNYLFGESAVLHSAFRWLLPAAPDVRLGIGFRF